MATDHNFRIKNGLEVGGVVIVNSSGQLQAVTVSSTQTFLDDVQLRFGNNNDLQIYHDPNNSFILHNNASGYFAIKNQTNNGSLFLHGDSVHLRTYQGNEPMLTAALNGAVTLYYDNNPKIATTSAGASVTGDLAVSGDLNITGNINSTSVTDLDVTDKTITMAVGSGSSAGADNAGVIIEGPSGGASMLWDHGNSYIEFNKALFSPTGYFVGTTGTKVGHLQNSAGVMLMEASTTRQIAFGNETNGEFARIDGQGRVGINQAPLTNNFALQVTGIQSNGTDARVVYLKGAGTATSIGSTGPTLTLQNTNTTVNNIVKLSFESASSGETVSINAINTNHGSHYGDMAFNTRGSGGYSEKMRIHSNGNIGIGDTTPDFKLAIRTPATPGGSSFQWPLDLSRTNTDSRGLTFGIGSDHHVIGAHNADISIGHTFGVDGNNLPRYYETMRFKHVDQSNFGLIGVGTTVPEAQMELYKIVDGDAQNLLIMNQKSYGVGSGTNERASINLGIAEASTSSMQRLFGNIHVRTNSESDSSNGTLSFGVRGAGAIRDDVLVIKGFSSTDQRVGIGVSSPDAKLHVNGAAIRVGPTSAPFADFKPAQLFATSAYHFASGNNTFFHFSNSSNAAKVSMDMANARVGIGVSSPSVALDVVGGANFYSGTASNSVNIGRNATERLQIDVTDNDITLTADQDSDSNGNHNFILNRTFDGSGASQFQIKNNGSLQFNMSATEQQFYNGTTYFGTNDSAAAMLHVFGAGAGTAEGGELRIYASADHDSSHDYFRIDAYQDDLRIGRAGQTDLTIDHTGQVIFGGDITLANDKDIHFLKADGTNDGTRLTRAGGNALRLKYATNAFILDAIDNTTVRFYNSGGDNIFQVNPNSTAASSTVDIVNGALRMGSTPVITNAKVLQNVTANASIITAGTIASARISGDYAIRSLSTSGQLKAKDDRIIEPNSINSSSLQFGFTSFGNDNLSPYADFLHMRSYSDSSGGNDNLLVLSKSSIAARVYQQGFNSSSAYSVYKNIVMTNDNSNNVSLAGTLTTASTIKVDPASGDATLSLESSSQTLNIDQNSIRSTTNSDITIFTNSNTRQLFLDQSSGRVGINMGSSDPASTLHIKDVGNNTVTSFRTNTFFSISGDGVVRWGSGAPGSGYGELTWDTGKAFVRGVSGKALHLGGGGRANDVIVSTSGVVQFNQAYTFPTSDGSSGQVLKTNGSGALTFQNDTSAIFTGGDVSSSINFTPDTGTFLSVDGQPILQRMTANGALTIGHDDHVIIAGGDTSSVMNTNLTNANEEVTLGAEGGVRLLAFPSNNVSWSNRKELKWDAAGLTLLNSMPLKMGSDTILDSTHGFSSKTSDGKFYAWSPVSNTSSQTNNYIKIATLNIGQSARFSIELQGRSTSYGDGQFPAWGKIVGQVNNDNNIDATFYDFTSGQNSDASKVVNNIYTKFISNGVHEVWVHVDSFSEIGATASVSTGTITVHSNNTGQTTTAPSSIVTVTKIEMWNSNNDGAGSGLNADTLDGVSSEEFLRSNQSDSAVGNMTFIGSGSTGNAFKIQRGANTQQEAFRVQNSGEVVVSNNYLYAAHTGTAFYSQGQAVFRNGILNDTSGQPLKVNDNLHVNGNAGIGISAPFSTLSINSNGAPTTSTGNMATTGLTVHNGTGGTAVQLGTYDAGSYGYIQSGYVNNATVARDFQIMNGANYTMTLASNGKVGIGQTSPRLKLEVKDTANSDGEVLYLMGSGSGGAGIVYSRNDSFTWFSGVGGGSGTGSIPLSYFGIVNRSQSTTPFVIAHTTGNVGIGTTAPNDGKLQIATTNQAGIFVRDSSVSNSAPFIRVQGQRSDGNQSESFSGGLVLEGYRTNAAVGTNKALGTIYFGGNHTNNSESNIAYAASIVGKAEGTFASASDMKTGLAFFTGQVGTALRTSNVDFGTERMRIDSSGAVGIKKIPPSGSHTSWSQLFIGEKGSVISENANSGGFYGTWLTDNMYIAQNTGAFKNITTDESSAYRQEGGVHQWFTHASGSANAAITLSERMRINTSGNVGINTTNPQGRLDVDGDLRVTANIVSNTVYQMLSLGSDRSINDYGGLNKDYWRMNIATPGASTDGGSSAHAFGTLIFSGVTGSNTTYSDRMAITAGGNVGIGTNTPAVKLDINGDAAIRGTSGRLYFDTNGAVRTNFVGTINNFETVVASGRGAAGFAVLGNSSIRLGFGTNHTTAETDLFIAQAGNVGIGNTTPQRRLTVTEASAGSASDNTGILSLTVGSGANTDSKMAFGIDSNNAGWIHVVKPGNNVMPLLLNPTNSANGRVGIGTNPTKALSVKAASGSNGGIDVFHSNGNKVAELVHHGSGDEGRLSLYDGGSETVRIHGETNQNTFIGSGNVGIGNTNPGEKLTVGGANNQGDINFHIGGHRLVAFGYLPGANTTTVAGYPAEIRHDPSGGTLRLGIDPTSRSVNATAGTATVMTIHEKQFVGIGELDPDMKLHISMATTPGIKFERPGTVAWRAGVSGTSFQISDSSDSLTSPELVLTNAGRLQVNHDPLSLASQPAIVGQFDASGTDGLALIQVQHLTASGAAALGAGIEFKVGDGTSGSATKSSYITQRGAGQLSMDYIADKNMLFFVDHHDNDLTGTNYQDRGSLAFEIKESGEVEPKYDLNVVGNIKQNGTTIVDTSKRVYTSSALYFNSANNSSLIAVDSTVNLRYMADGKHIFQTYVGGWGTRAEIDDNGLAMRDGHDVRLFNSSTTGNGNVHLPRDGAISFFGDTSMNHSIGARNTDDIRLNTYGAFIVNLDSNGNNGTGTADFTIGRHAQATNAFGTSDILFRVAKDDGDVTAKGDVTAFNSFSDIRLKENVEVIADPLAKVLKLKGITFNYKDSGKRSTGLIAQDLEEVLPEAVYETEKLGDEETTVKAVRYGNTVGLLVEAIKEQQTIINRLEERINKLEGENNGD